MPKEHVGKVQLDPKMEQVIYDYWQERKEIDTKMIEEEEFELMKMQAEQEEEEKKEVEEVDPSSEK